MVKPLRFLPAFFAVLGLIAMPGTALPQSKKDGMEKKAKQHKHKNGKDLLGAKLKKGGEHKIHANGKHSAFVQVSNGKVTGVKVRHADKGDVPVTKYKSKKKMADASDSGFQTVSFVVAQLDYLGWTWIGFSYIDDYGDEIIYWFPYDMVYDSDTGAIEYIPIA